MTLPCLLRFPALSQPFASLAWALIVLSGPVQASAQEPRGLRVTGTLVSEEGNRPLEGAWMGFLKDDSVRARTTTDRSGRFSVDLPGPGRYLITVDLLGYADWASPPMDITQHQDLTLLIPLAPIELEGLVAEGLSECRASAEDLRAGSELIQEMAPVLQEIEANSSLDHFRYAMEVSRPVKRWNRQRWRWMGWDTVRVLSDAVIAIEPPEVLVREGYAVVVDDSTNLYRPPGPGTLASESFRSTHCISKVRNDSTGLVGLAFEPKETGTTLEVSGTLWIEVQGNVSLPKRLEFTYVNLQPHLEERHLPGLVAWFEEEHPGWIIRSSPIGAGLRRRIEESPGGFLNFREVSDGLLMISEWEVDQLSLYHSALFDNSTGVCNLEPWVRGIPTHVRLLALVPRERKSLNKNLGG